MWVVRTFAVELTTFYCNTDFEINYRKKNHTADNNVPVVKSMKGYILSLEGVHFSLRVLLFVFIGT
jgi:hypothetical protein